MNNTSSIATTTINGSQPCQPFNITWAITGTGFTDVTVMEWYGLQNIGTHLFQSSITGYDFKKKTIQGNSIELVISYQAPTGPQEGQLTATTLMWTPAGQSTQDLSGTVLCSWNSQG